MKKVRRHTCIRITAPSLRYQAESNCCARFCRPMPNHSAMVPYVVFDCKGSDYFLSTKKNLKIACKELKCLVECRKCCYFAL